MSLKKTLFVGVLFLSLLGFIFYVEEPGEKAKEDAKLLLPGVTQENFEKLSITNTIGDIQLTKNGTNWTVNQKGFNATDAGSVNSVISGLTSFRIENSIPADEVEKDLKIYGLDKPTVTVTFSESGKEQSIQFGKKNEFTSKRYAKLKDSGSIFFVTEELFNAASKAPADFRDKTPLDFADSDVANLKIKSSKRDYEFKYENGTWSSVKPLPVTISKVAMSELFMALRNLSVQKYFDPSEKSSPADKDFGLEKPSGKVELTFVADSKKEPITLSFASKKRSDGENFLRVSNLESIFALTADPLPQIFKDFDAFREHNLVSFSTDEVSTVNFELKDKPALKLEKISDNKGTTWKVDGTEGDNAFCQNLVTELANTKAESFPTESLDYGFDKPTLKVTISLKNDGAKEKVLVVGKKFTEGKETKGYFAGVDSLTEPFIISEATLNRITPKKEALLPVKKTEDTAKKDETNLPKSVEFDE